MCRRGGDGLRFLWRCLAASAVKPRASSKSWVKGSPIWLSETRVVYAQARIVPVQILVGLPDGLSDQQGAAMMLKGMTAQFLVRQISRVKAGDTVLFHALPAGSGSLPVNG
jgi:NADPH:quinone reductase